MSDYILIYNIDDYFEMGGGLQEDSFDTEKELDKKVEEIIIAGHTLIHAGKLDRYSYKTVEVAQKVVRGK